MSRKSLRINEALSVIQEIEEQVVRHWGENQPVADQRARVANATAIYCAELTADVAVMQMRGSS